MGDPNDAGMLKGTALRGIQPTDSHGIASFDTLVPGHYDGRATHIHGREPTNSFLCRAGNTGLTDRLSHHLPRRDQAGQQHHHGRQGGARRADLL